MWAAVALLTVVILLFWLYIVSVFEILKILRFLKMHHFPQIWDTKGKKIENHIVEIEISILQFLEVVICADLCLEDSLYAESGNRRKQPALIPI